MNNQDCCLEAENKPRKPTQYQPRSPLLSFSNPSAAIGTLSMPTTSSSLCADLLNFGILCRIKPIAHLERSRQKCRSRIVLGTDVMYKSTRER